MMYFGNSGKFINTDLFFLKQMADAMMDGYVITGRVFLAWLSQLRYPDHEIASLNDCVRLPFRKVILPGENLIALPELNLDLQNADLHEADLRRTKLGWLNLTGADLTGANLTRANLTEANLTGADLTRANLTGANLTRANLTGANLTGAYLTEAYLEEANLTGADLTGANLTLTASICHSVSSAEGIILSGAFIVNHNEQGVPVKEPVTLRHFGITS